MYGGGEGGEKGRRWKSGNYERRLAVGEDGELKDKERRNGRVEGKKEGRQCGGE